jgi:hypothetical protein
MCRDEEDMSKQHPWDAAAAIPIWRLGPFDDGTDIEPGARYFILQLERIGARTSACCEGHPARNRIDGGGFYILFQALERVARRVAAAGGFDVTVWHLGGWRLQPLSRHRTEAERRRDLRSAALCWERALGPLDIAAAKDWPAHRRFRP